MFTAVYNTSSKLVIAVGDFSPIPHDCARSKVIDGNPPNPMWIFTEEFEIQKYLYAYDEEENKLTKAMPMVMVVSEE